MKKTPAKKENTKVSVKKESKKTPVKKTSAKKTTTKVASKATAKKVVKKTQTTKKETKVTVKKTSTKTKEVSYPSGKIVNSKVLTSVERGYLELAGFKSYKDAFTNLDTPAKRTKIAKEVTTTATVLNNSLKKLELISINGLAESSVAMLCEVGINSVAKLQKADSKKCMLKFKN